MTLDELKAILVEAPAEDWHVVDGYPTYRDNVGVIRDGLEHMTSHYHTAVYAKDLNLTIAWGMGVSGDEGTYDPDSIGAQLGKTFPDQTVSSFQVDVFYNGALVDRQYGIHVDGYRAVLPYSKYERLPETPPEDPSGLWTASRWDAEFFRLIDALSGHHDYDSYLERSPIIIEG